MQFGYLLPTRGVVLGSNDGMTLASRTESDILGLARRAEAGGFNSVWVGDSILAKPRLDPLITLSAIAAKTDAIQLGTAVYLPALRHPVPLAQQLTTLDQVSGGRVTLGVGVGIGPDVAAEHENLGIPFSKRGKRLDETLDILRRLGAGDRIDYDGEFYTLSDASIGFQSVDDLRISIASAAFDPREGFPKSIRNRLIEYGTGWMPIGVDPDAYEAGANRIRTMLSEAGRNPTDFSFEYYIDIGIDEDESAAIDEARLYYDRYYPSWDTLSDDEIRGKGAFGPTENAVETLREYEDAGVETIILRFPATNQRRQLRRFLDLVYAHW